MVDLPSHPPAVKVGGRRLSVNTRPKPQAQANPEPTAESDAKDAEESAKREKKTPFDKHAQRKPDTRPTRDAQGNFKSFAGARIAQPAGKSFGI